MTYLSIMQVYTLSCSIACDGLVVVQTLSCALFSPPPVLLISSMIHDGRLSIKMFARILACLRAVVYGRVCPLLGLQDRPCMGRENQRKCMRREIHDSCAFVCRFILIVVVVPAAANYLLHRRRPGNRLRCKLEQFRLDDPPFVHVSCRMGRTVCNKELGRNGEIQQSCAFRSWFVVRALFNELVSSAESWSPMKVQVPLRNHAPLFPTKKTLTS
jgi:hypothetical protein